MYVPSVFTYLSKLQMLFVGRSERENCRLSFQRSSIFPVNSLRVGVHGRVYGNIERSTYVNFNAPFLQKLQSAVRATRVYL